MSSQLLTANQAAERLGVTVTTLYDWLGQSNHGSLVIRGQPVTIRYFQGGRNGQGRIRLESSEVERVNELMRVLPQRAPVRRPHVQSNALAGITVPLGRPPA